MAFQFPKEIRLRLKKEMDLLFEKGNSFYKYPYKILWDIEMVELVSEGNLKLLISAPKRLHRTAVARNLIKRRTREAFRLKKEELMNELAPYNQVLKMALIYNQKSIYPYKELEASVEAILKKMVQIIKTAHESQHSHDL